MSMRDKCCPLAVFDEIKNVAAVTCAENRLYSWLLRKHWHIVASELPPMKMEQLSIEFLGGSELAVHWTGDAACVRRLVVVAHTDRDGYILREGMVTPQRGPTLVHGARPSPIGLPPMCVEKEREDLPVRIIGGRDLVELDCRGRIQHVNSNLDGQQEAGAIVIRLDTDVGAEPRMHDLLNQAKGTVTAHHILTETAESENSLSAWGIDNGAGVAVATAVLTRIAIGVEPINVSVLYTTGEKNGFTGLLRYIVQDAKRLAESADEVAWVVVDSSEASQARLIGLDEWRALRLNASGTELADIRGHDDILPDAGLHCPLIVAVIRLEDRVSALGLSGARMLYQAALSLRGKEPAQAAQGARSGQAGLGSAGVFVGGRCEATVLAHLNDLLRALGHRPRLRDRVCSLAIPLYNWRLLNREKLALTVSPERTSTTALQSAAAILHEACRLHHDYWYADETPCGFRPHPMLESSFGKGCVPNSRDDYVKILLERGKHVNRSCAVDEWVRNTGVALVKSLPKPDWRAVLARR